MDRRLFGALWMIRGALCWVFCLLLLVSCVEPTPVAARRGVLDLRDWNPADGPVRLTGEWSFQEDELLPPGNAASPALESVRNVPDRWPHVRGVGTYRLEVLLPASEDVLELYIEGVAGAGRAWLDDKPMPLMGQVSEDVVGTRESLDASSIAFSPPVGRTVVITVQVSNQRYRMGGMIRAPELGEASWMAERAQRRFFLFGVSVTVMGTMMLVFLGMALVRGKNPTNLYFCGFCLVHIVRELAMGNPPVLSMLWPGIPWLAILHIEYVCLPLGTVLGLGLIAGFARIPTSRPWVRRTQIAGLVLAAATLLSPAALDPSLLRFNQVWVAYVLGLSLWMLVDATRREVVVARYLLGLTSIAGAAFLHDMIGTTSFYSPPARLASAGFIAYLVGMGWLMVQSFAYNLTRVELLAEAVQKAHHRLERTHKSVLRFVPVEFLDFLGKNSIEEVHRGDRTDLILTVQFSDVRSFTTITEKLSPGETFDLVGDYLERVCKPVSAHNGFVDKYIGDAVMALFLSADEAMKSCLEQLAALDATNEQRSEKGEISFEVGFGLHTGPVTLGTVGSTDRIDCTVLGDSVNLASRIESLTVRYGTRLLVSSSVVDALSSPGDYELREVDRVVVKGKTEPVRLFEVVDPLPAERRVQRMAALQSFSAARDALFEGRFEAACELFEGASQADPGDLATELLWKRARELWEAGATDPAEAVARLSKK